jgi:hypothetical protein
MTARDPAAVARSKFMIFCIPSASGPPSPYARHKPLAAGREALVVLFVIWLVSGASGGLWRA